jgi:hypothetical protein
MNPFPAYLHDQLEDNLKQHRIVVWYDPNREFAPWVEAMGRTESEGSLPFVQIGGTQARLAIFGGSYFALRLQVEPLVAVNRPQPLLIYLPGAKRDAKASVLMELELAGTSWEPQMKRLARNVMRKSYSDGVIDEMLAPESLTFADICSLLEQRTGDGKGSILQIIFDTPDNVAMVAAWLADVGRDEELVRRDGVRELHKLLASRAGFQTEESVPLPKVREKAGRYFVINEFRHDLRCEPPGAVSMVPSPGTKDQREFGLKVLDHLRTRYASAFQNLADAVEAEYGLANCGIQATDLGSIDTFRFEERAMLRHCGEQIAGGDYATTANMVAIHSQSFWARQDLSRRQAQWEVCALLASLGTEVERVESELKKSGLSAKMLFDRYVAADGWHRLDWAHRRLECRMSQMEEEPENDQAVALLRARMDSVLKTMALTFGKALMESGWTLPGSLHQTQIWPQKVAALSGRVAYFLVDAFRFEMGADLFRQVSEALDTELSPAVTVLPSITPLGMAALLPGASSSYSVVEHQGKAAAKIGETILSDVNDRMKHLKAMVPDATEITLERLLQDSPSKVSAKIEKARIVVVRSQEIDALGEKSELLARNMMDTVIGNLARAVRRLAGMGIERFVITADHGHQFSTRKEDDMKMPATNGGTIETHRRAWIGRGANSAPGTVAVTAPQLGYDSNLEFVFPEGLGVFKGGGSLAYHHGGFSLQEMVTPVLSFRMPGVASAASGPRVRIVSQPSAITTRTFGVEIEAESDLLATEPHQLRILLANKGEEAGYAGMAMGQNFDRDTRILSLMPGGSASLAMVLSREDFDAVRIVVQDAQTGASLAETTPIPLQLKL